MTDDFISIGKITSTFGLKGFLKVASSGDILSSLKPKSKVFFESKGDYSSIELLAIRRDKNIYILSLEGFTSIDASEKLVGKLLYYPRSESKNLLDKDEYFVHQLIGLHPFSQGKILSEFKLLEVLDNPVHPILVFTDSVSEILIPYINKFVGEIDLENGRIEILNWEDWLFAD